MRFHGNKIIHGMRIQKIKSLILMIFFSVLYKQNKNILTIVFAYPLIMFLATEDTFSIIATVLLFMITFEILILALGRHQKKP